MTEKRNDQVAVSRALNNLTGGFDCPVCRGHDFALDPEYRDDIYRVRCNCCGNILTFDKELLDDAIPSSGIKVHEDVEQSGGAGYVDGAKASEDPSDKAPKLSFCQKVIFAIFHRKR